MSKEVPHEIKIDTTDLVIGMYIDLELSWSEHPFTFSRFKIKTEKDLKAIRSLKIKQVTVFPKKSDGTIAVLDNDSELPNTPVEPEVDAELEKLWLEKNKQQEKANILREKRKMVTRQYHERTSQIRQITNDMKNRPANAIHNIDEIVNDMMSLFDGDEDLATNLVNLSSSVHDDYNHITNVTMLSLMLGATAGITGEQLKLLGTGALLHDIGKIEVPGSIKIKKTALSPAEKIIMQRHTITGRQLIERVREMDQKVLDVIDKHHELIDGSGYPKGLTGEYLSNLVRIVAIVNQYDNLCNPGNPNAAMTPKNALATLYQHYQDRLDTDLIKILIGLLGVYPPGTVVRFEDEGIGLVISSNPKASLRPGVLIYDPNIPKEEALIIDLCEHPDVKILEALLPSDFPPGIHSYLGIKERIGYMIEKSSL